ncbi:MAG: radical SAM protein [Bacteroidetes bacterium]|nr:radical SAM protein [Bacteroidota bacterium]
MDSKLIIPDELRFAVTLKCNGACRHCYNLSGKDFDRLSADDFIRIIKEVYELNPNLDRMVLTGGEPMLEKEKVLQITRFARSLGIKVRLVTRGWELNTAVCHELKEAGVTKIQIGLDSSGEINYTDEENQNWDTYHSWLRDDKRAWSKTIHAIKTAVDAGLEVSIRYSLCRSNLKDVVKTYQFVSALGVSKFKFRVLFPDGRAKQRMIHELIKGEEMANAQYDLIQASKANKTMVEITQPCMYSLPHRADLTNNGHEYNVFKEECSCGEVVAYIDAKGDVKYCLFDENPLGNVFKDSFLNVWNSIQAMEARQLRCPLDKSGSNCSSFNILYAQFNDYTNFMNDYIKGTKEKKINIINT